MGRVTRVSDERDVRIFAPFLPLFIVDYKVVCKRLSLNAESINHKSTNNVGVNIRGRSSILKISLVAF